YHWAKVVEENRMHMTHVIRGEEWVPSMPRHILLYEALGWSETRPQFAHLPLILKPTGKGKLSKRDGDKMGFPVFPLKWTDPKTGDVSRGYREDGYFPEAFVNLLALLGWNAGTEQEFFTMDELISEFSLERVVKAGARFDPEKAKWFNRHYFQQKDDAVLAAAFRPLLAEKGIDASDERVVKVVGIVKERCEFVTELWEQSDYFFVAPESYDDKTVKKKWKEDTPEKLQEITALFQSIEQWDAAIIKEAFSNFMNEKGWGFGVVMVPIRLALVGTSAGADLFDICEIIGKTETISRIQKAIAKIG
nr:glutamate--tRNA ligase [Sunxiuqinia sp.]